MKALTDAPARKLHGTRCRLNTQPSTVTTMATDAEEDQAIGPVGRLVAGRYQLRSLLGRGGMGGVWLAEDELLHRPVALKQVVLIGRASEESRRAALVRALAEARAAARVHHDGVVRIHDLAKQGGHPWIVMELLSGRNLAQILDGQGPLSIEQVRHIGLSLLDALHAVHRAGVVHCDVKPANVQLCQGGRVVLTDFGIARSPDDDLRSLTHIFVGSPAHASPEWLRRDKPRPASDLLSLGATLFSAVEGRPPFDRG